jgi:hypothetical protein
MFGARKLLMSTISLLSSFAWKNLRTNNWEDETTTWENWRA